MEVRPVKISTQELVNYRKLGKHTSAACLSLSSTNYRPIARARRTDVNTYVLARGLYTYKTRVVGGGTQTTEPSLYFHFTPTQEFISFIQFMLLFLHDSTLHLTILSNFV